MACRDCKFYDLEAIKNKAGRVMRDKVARCNWRSTEVWPSSVEGRFGNSRPSPTFMEPDDGANCPCFTATGGNDGTV